MFLCSRRGIIVSSIENKESVPSEFVLFQEDSEVTRKRGTMAILRLITGGCLVWLLISACAETKTEVSWSDKDFKGKIKNVYIIGIAKNDFNRTYFEDVFYNKLKSEGLRSIPSSTDLPQNQETSKDIIIQKMEANGCDSVLLTRVTNKHTEATFTSDQSSMQYVPGPYYGGVRFYDRPTYYDTWDRYYSASYRAVLEPPTTTNITVITVESVLYDLQTEKLIWSAKMDAKEIEANIEEIIQKFVNEAARDLKETGLI